MDELDDKFEVVLGIWGLVMMVFYFLFYGVVFKIIKDEFVESKKIMCEYVKECYKFVKMFDCVGWMVDIYEYVNFRFLLDRIEFELIDEFKEMCVSSLEFIEFEFIIKYMYIEWKMMLFNLYL